MNPSLTRLLESRMPRDQANAYLESGLVTRVGIPHRSGKLVFHAFNEGYPVMVSANAFWGKHPVNPSCQLGGAGRPAMREQFGDV
ncbi:hypothetical protein DEE93_18050, partial [Ralstonia pickettii]|nr:hypothetical protein [Ralstonia pickettii]MBB0041132.1 hypothetical protein [Ralstonia pickettii]MBX3755447.1 hypothetical protein [Ralstonia pickettii]MBX3784227.1 hypothetical protein [Ralstonia pickettii]MBX3789319.1 hypothetical protein [Ralstonia pickettii]